MQNRPMPEQEIQFSRELVPYFPPADSRKLCIALFWNHLIFIESQMTNSPDHNLQIKNKVMEWAQQDLLECKTMDDLLIVWNRFPCFHKQWQFVELAKKVKKRIFNEHSRKDT